MLNPDGPRFLNWSISNYALLAYPSIHQTIIHLAMLIIDQLLHPTRL